MFLRKTLAPTAVGILLLAALAVAPAAPVAAQEIQDEGAAYRAWHAASQAGDSAKAVAAAKEYLDNYPGAEAVCGEIRVMRRGANVMLSRTIVHNEKYRYWGN